MGLDFDFVKGEGPVDRPSDSAPRDVDRLRDFEPREALGARARDDPPAAQRAGRIACRSSASAARRSRWPRTRSKAGRRRPTHERRRSCTRSRRAWHRLCDRFADDDGRLPEGAGRGRRAGDAGVRLVGRRARPRATTASSRCRTPRGSSTRCASSASRSIHFGVGTTAILPDLREAGGDVIGVDWRLPLDEAWDIIGHDRGIQGNLDPTLLLGPRDRLFARRRRCPARAGGRAGPHLQSRPRHPADRRRSSTCRRSRGTCTIHASSSGRASQLPAPAGAIGSPVAGIRIPSKAKISS